MAQLPTGFVYLEDIDPSILQEIRYATHHNFLGRPVDGYLKNRCIVTEPLARALAQAQQTALKLNLTLKVYEAYRPLRAASDFLKWAKDCQDQSMKAEFYPHLDKATLFEAGYIAVRSQHSRGAAVDLTLVPLPVPSQPTYKPGDPLMDSSLPKAQRFQDNSIDMGTGFDCFHEKSHTWNPTVPEEAKRNRALLCGIMTGCGLRNYEKEWWHFSLTNEPFPDLYFDFLIE